VKIELGALRVVVWSYLHPKVVVRCATPMHDAIAGSSPRSRAKFCVGAIVVIGQSTPETARYACKM
jgi:hypothetical protein